MEEFLIYTRNCVYNIYIADIVLIKIDDFYYHEISIYIILIYFTTSEKVNVSNVCIPSMYYTFINRVSILSRR